MDKTQKSISISVPNLGPKIQGVMEDTLSLALIECAPSCKVEFALLSWMLSRVIATPGIHLWVSKNPRIYRARLAYWLESSMGKRFFIQSRGDIKFPTVGSRIIFCEHDDAMTQDVDRVGDVVITDAQDMGDDPQLWLIQNAAGKVRIAGNVGSPSHWFYKICRKVLMQSSEDRIKTGTSYHRVTVVDALEAKIVKQADIDKVKRAIPDALFNQLYHCRAEAEIDREAAQLSTKKFAEQRLFIRDKTGRIIPFQLNYMQQRYLAMKRLAVMKGKAKKFLLLKYRRGGFTTLEQAENYKTIVTQPNSQVVTLAHSADSTKRIFRIAHLYHEKDMRALSLKGTPSGSKLEIESLNSLFFIGTAGATGFGRGDTLQRVHGSEVSKWCKGPRQTEQVNDLIAGLTEATSHGEVVLETTADGHEWFAMKYKEAKAGLNDWVPLFVPWFMDRSYVLPVVDPDEILSTLTPEETDLISRHGLSINQIQWRRKKMSGLQKLFKQEYPEDDETCFLTTGTSFFDSDLILELLEKLPEYKKEHLAGGYRVEWEQPIPGEKYVMGGDTSEGITGCDPSGYGILHRDSGRQVAEVHGLFKPEKFAALVIEGSNKYNNALFGIERENHGHAVLQKINALGRGKSHLNGGACYHYTKGRAGWTTNEQTRPIMLDAFAEALHEGYIGVKDREMLGECLTFKLQSGGRFEADPGCHDDKVMKWAIAWQMRGVRRVRPTITLLGGESDDADTSQDS